MHAAPASIALGVVAWVSLGAVGLVLAALARFYGQRARRQTRYRAIAVAAIGLGAAGVWDAWSGSGESLPGVLLALSGMLLGVTARHLFAMMMAGAD